MNRFIIVDGLPYLYADGKAYAVRWNEEGFTVGAEVEIAEAPTNIYSELSILAKCAGNLNSIDQEDQHSEPEAEDAIQEDQHSEPEAEDAIQEDQHSEPEAEDAIQEDQHSEPEAEEFNKMKISELKSYAEENGIDLGEAKTKVEIIKAIKAVE
ncbi:hypothetical protein ACPW7J_02205 [Ihubacter sp. rT4E-8]|uniref:hypothetical protein n=1 Tax=Ihubacter sp. rT4E-8 TaxID=3242369 RepID=UPI003CF07E04